MMIAAFVHDKVRQPRQRSRVLCCVLAALLLDACSSAPPPPSRHDFGLPLQKPLAAPRLPASRALDAVVTAPAWLDSPALWYRLAYADPGQLQAYTRSAWVAPPAALLQARLREALDLQDARPGDAPTAAGQVRLQVELEEFSQVFDSAASSHAQLQAQVRVIDAAPAHGTGIVLAQRRFALEQPADTPDADGALRALRGAVDRFVVQVLEWTATVPVATAAAR